MEYELVYDAAKAPYSFWWLPLLPLALACFWFLVRHHLPNRNVLNHWRTAVLVGLSATLVLAWMVVGRGYRLRRALEAGRVHVVEGRVTEFVPGSPSGNGAEVLTVRDDSQTVRFEYGPAVLTPGYHAVARRGSLLREGARVRVSFVASPIGPAIARLEVVRDSLPTAGRLTTR